MRTRFYFFAVATVVLIVSACNTVKPYEKERLSDRTMIFDYDPATSVLRADIITPRTGSLGGFSSASAGGCSCK